MTIPDLRIRVPISSSPVLLPAAGLAGDRETSAQLLGAADSARRAASVPALPSERAEIDRITATTRTALRCQL